MECSRSELSFAFAMMSFGMVLVQFGRGQGWYPRVFQHEPAMSTRRDIDWLFRGRHCDREVIGLYVRWYPRYELSLRDLVEMMAERGLPHAHTTIMRWVKRFTPEFVTGATLSVRRGFQSEVCVNSLPFSANVGSREILPRPTVTHIAIPTNVIRY